MDILTLLNWDQAVVHTKRRGGPEDFLQAMERNGKEEKKDVLLREAFDIDIRGKKFSNHKQGKEDDSPLV